MRLELAAVIGVVFLAGPAVAGEGPALETPRDRLSYGMGISVAQNLKRQGVEVDAELLARGLKDGLSGQKPLMTADEVRAAMSQLQVEQKQRRSKPSRAAEESRSQGRVFMAANAGKEGVVTLESGLQYKVLRAGDGKRPTDTDRVVCHYRGTFVDGTEFDSSYGRGRPATFDLAKVIPGWREALKLMPVGSKWQLFIPPQLAYGERGMRGKKHSRGVVGPEATLIFETEFLAIQPGPASPGTTTASAAGPLDATEN